MKYVHKIKTKTLGTAQTRPLLQRRLKATMTADTGLTDYLPQGGIDTRMDRMTDCRSQSKLVLLLTFVGLTETHAFK